MNSLIVGRINPIHSYTLENINYFVVGYVLCPGVPNLAGPNLPGQNLPQHQKVWGPICSKSARGLIYQGPICLELTSDRVAWLVIIGCCMF